MQAKDKFKVGDRVRLSDLGRTSRLFPARRVLMGEIYGYVVGFNTSPLSVRVRPTHRKTNSGYHMDFWEKADQSNLIQQEEENSNG